MICSGCGCEVPPGEPHPFRCPRWEAGDDVDHVLRRVLDPAHSEPPEPSRDLFLRTGANPFEQYRHLFHAYQIARWRGLSDRVYCELVADLDRAVAAVEARPHGFSVTPFAPAPDLAGRLGLTGDAVWIKDETGNVAGSHKGRHLFGLGIWLEVMERLDPGHDGGAAPLPLAIASCGNAALAAAVVARAMRRRLRVFIPPWAETPVVRRLEELGAELVVCPRQGDAPGDPCYLRFREGVARGAVPFTCQGSDNGLTIEGGKTLAWEIVSAVLRDRRRIDRLFVQVGGGALASSCIQALEEARDLGLIPSLPRLHAVQTEGGYPLRRAWERVLERSLGLSPRPSPARSPGEDQERADGLLTRFPPPLLDEPLRHAATHRSAYMWPWEEEPRSIASGILDDETYDWLAVVRGTVASGGYPVVVGEEALREAHGLAREATGIPADPTGTAGLAGYLRLLRAGVVAEGETVALLFTGVERR